MNDLRAAAQQFVTDYENGDLGDLKHYARALRAALAQQEQEPVAWMRWDNDENYYDIRRAPPPQEAIDYLAKWNRPAWHPLYTHPPRRETEQEPVAYTGDVALRMREAGMTFHLGMPHAAVMEQMTRFHDLVCAEASIKAAAAFATPPRREWQSLRNKEIVQIVTDRLTDGDWIDVARAIEQALKERNNG